MNRLILTLLLCWSGAVLGQVVSSASPTRFELLCQTALERFDLFASSYAPFSHPGYQRSAARSNMPEPASTTPGRAISGDLVTVAIRTDPSGVDTGVAAAPFLLAGSFWPSLPPPLTRVIVLGGTADEGHSRLGLAYHLEWVSGKPLPSLQKLGFACAYDMAERTDYAALLESLREPFFNVCDHLVANIPRPASDAAAGKNYDAAALFCGFTVYPTPSGVEDSLSFSVGTEAISSLIDFQQKLLRNNGNVTSLISLNSAVDRVRDDLELLKKGATPTPDSCRAPTDRDARIDVEYERLLWSRWRLSVAPGLLLDAFPVQWQSGEPGFPLSGDNVSSFQAQLEASLSKRAFTFTSSAMLGPARTTIDSTFNRDAKLQCAADRAIFALGDRTLELNDSGKLPAHVAVGSAFQLEMAGAEFSDLRLRSLQWEIVRVGFLLSDSMRFRLAVPVRAERLELDVNDSHVVWSVPVSAIYSFGF